MHTIPSPEHGALADGDVGVEGAWYLLGRHPCKKCSSPSLNWISSGSSRLGDAEEGS